MDEVDCSKLLACRGISRQQAQQVVGRLSQDSAARPQFRRREGQLPLSKLSAVFRFLGRRRFDSHLAGSLNVAQFFHMSEVMNEDRFQKFAGGLTKLPLSLRTLYAWSCSLASMDKFSLDRYLEKKPASLFLEKCPAWSRWLQRKTGRRFLLEAVATSGPMRFECTDGGIEPSASVAHYCNPLGCGLELEVEDPLPVFCSLKTFDEMQQVLRKVLALKQVSTNQFIKVYRVANYLNVTPILDLLEERFRDDPFLLVDVVSNGKISPGELPWYTGLLLRDCIKRIGYIPTLRLAHLCKDEWLLEQACKHAKYDDVFSCISFIEWAQEGENPPFADSSRFGMEVRAYVQRWPSYLFQHRAANAQKLSELLELGKHVGNSSFNIYLLWHVRLYHPKRKKVFTKQFIQKARALSFDQTLPRVLFWLWRRRPAPILDAYKQGLLKDLSPADGNIVSWVRWASYDGERFGWYLHLFAIECNIPLTRRALLPWRLGPRTETWGKSIPKRHTTFLRSALYGDAPLLDEHSLRGELARKYFHALVSSIVRNVVSDQKERYFGSLYSLFWKQASRAELKDLVRVLVYLRPQVASGWLGFSWPLEIQKLRDRDGELRLDQSAFERVAPYLQRTPGLILDAAEEGVISAKLGAFTYWNCELRSGGQEMVRFLRLSSAVFERPYTQKVATMFEQAKKYLFKRDDPTLQLSQIWSYACELGDPEVKRVCQFFALENMRRGWVEELPGDLSSSLVSADEFPYSQVLSHWGVRRYFFLNPWQYSSLVKLGRIDSAHRYEWDWEEYGGLSRGARELDFADLELQEKLSRKTCDVYPLLREQPLRRLLQAIFSPARKVTAEIFLAAQEVLIEKIDEDSCGKILGKAAKFHNYELIKACREFVYAEPGRLERVWPLGVPEWLEKYLD